MIKRTAVFARVRRVLLVGGLALAALPATPAIADITIGRTGSSPSTCVTGVTVAETTYVVPPGGGVITSFSFESSARNAGQRLDFLVLRTAGGSNYTVVGKTGVVTLQGTGLEGFPVNIPVQGGEILGFWLSPPGTFDDCVRLGGTEGGQIHNLFGDPGDPIVGGLVSLPNGPFPGNALNLSANLVTTPVPTIADVTDSVNALNLAQGIRNSLLSKLIGAQKNLAGGHTAGACGKLASFISEVKAQRGKKIATADADDLIDRAAAVRQSLGCSGT